jgi:hypothetical protein
MRSARWEHATKVALKEKHKLTDITERFSLGEIDHHELLALLTLRYVTCWRVSDRAITFPAVREYSLKVEMRHGQITSISSGNSLSGQELTEILEQVEADLKDDRIAEYGAEILFAHRPVKGAFRFRSVPIQILSPPPEAPQQNIASAHPFVIEYPITAYKTSEVRFLRRRKCSMEWAWVLNALLRGSIKFSASRLRQMWAIKCGDPDARCFWAQEFYMHQGFQAFRTDLSQQGSPLPVVRADEYYGGPEKQANVPIDTFFLPDNLDELVGAYLKLDAGKRRRFLRSAAAIYTARELWELSVSSSFLACVQAIETLVDRPPPTPCPTCNKDMGPGPTKLFREFVEEHCGTSDVDQAVVNQLYRTRSALAHGHYLFQLDEAPWALNIGATVASHHELELARSALTVSKDALRNWLLAQ